MSEDVVEVFSPGLVGLEARVVRVRAEIGGPSASWRLLGLPEAHAREVRLRVHAALQQLGVEIHDQGVVVTIEPKELAAGGALDLAIAVAVLVALRLLPADAAQDLALIGELSLDGGIRPVRGVLPRLQGAAKFGIPCAIVPATNAREAAHVSGLRVLVAEHLRELVEHLQGVKLLAGVEPAPALVPAVTGHDLAEVRGLDGVVRRVLEIAGAGGHDLLLVGPPGASKIMAARRLPSILPPLTPAEMLELTSLYSVAGLLTPEVGAITVRPFRAPHQTVSSAGLIGGGDPVRPGEVSLAHHGVLFLDELHEHRRANLDDLHRVLVEGHATICRAKQRVTFPAKPMLVGTILPCPCGYAGSGSSRCSCSAERIATFRARFSGPFFERFDLRILVPGVDVAQLQTGAKSETCGAVQARIVEARARQHARAAKLNAQLSPTELAQFAAFELGGMKLSEVEQRRVRRVARTLADLDGSDLLREPHVAEALQLSAHPFPTRSR